jgi:hypothetical protein
MGHKRRIWLRSLKVGEVVCDCRYKHLKIAEIERHYWAFSPLSRFLPSWLPLWVDDAWHRVAYALGFTTLGDCDLVLEDGAHCSAIACCHPADHEWEHPSMPQSFYDKRRPKDK